MGIDMSVRSPAWTIWDLHQKVFHVFALQKKESNPVGMYCGSRNGNLMKVTLFENHPDLDEKLKEVGDRTRVYRYLVGLMLTSMKFVIDDERPVNVMVENYAYGATSSPSDHLLKELGGFLRCELSYHFPRIVWYERFPTTVKLFWTGNGRATKKEMIQAYEAKGFPKLPSHTNPWEDMVDSIAIVHLLKSLLE